MSRFWYRKGAVWMRRYLPAELLGTVCAIVGGLLVGAGNPLLAAFGGTWGENLGYYGMVITRDLRARRAQGGPLTAGGVLLSLRNIALEFGGAELLDSFLIRPGAIYAAISLTGSLPLGLILGKVAADLTFYLPTIVAYELRLRFLGE